MISHAEAMIAIKAQVLLRADPLQIEEIGHAGELGGGRHVEGPGGGAMLRSQAEEPCGGAMRRPR